MRVFAYCRVSTAEQETDNQLREIAAAGFAIDPSRVIEEIISGSTRAVDRPGFVKLVERIDEGDILVVTKLDRLGRNAMDVVATVQRFEARKARVHCLALGGMDLTSAAGKMTMTVLAAVAEFELDLLKERTTAGMARSRAEGRIPGRPGSLGPAEIEEARALRAAPEPPSFAKLAKRYGVGKTTVQRALAR